MKSDIQEKKVVFFPLTCMGTPVLWDEIQWITLRVLVVILWFGLFIFVLELVFFEVPFLPVMQAHNFL